jgi:phage terminase large subunit-like protein
VIAFIESLVITAGKLAGQPFTLRVWQRRIIERIYATRPDGTRPIRTAVLSFGRKNGKTALAAGLALCHLAGPEAEARGEVYSAANDRFQAGKIFNEMVAMIDAHPHLRGRINVKAFSKELSDERTGSVYAALSSDAGTKMGLSPSCVIYDEFGQSSSRDLYDALDTAMGAREDPLMMVISTQAATETAPLSTLIDYGLQVESGAVEDPSFALFLYAAPVEADPWAEETWTLANPALGDFCSLEEVRRQASQARRMPSKEPAFRNLILNQRISGERQFVSAREWMACAAIPDAGELHGAECYAGLDLSAVRDLTALVLAFPRADGHVDVLPFFWLPGDALAEREDEDKVPYQAWARAGQLLTTPGATIDPAFIAAKIADLAGLYDLRGIAFDRWRIDTLKPQLAERGVTVELSAHGQGFKDMAPAVDQLERMIAERRLRHGAHPVLTMCAANTVATADPANNRKLDKARSRGRIDGMVALAMALGAASKRMPGEEWQPMCEVL